MGAALRLEMFGRAPLTEAGLNDVADIDNQDHDGNQKDKADKNLNDELKRPDHRHLLCHHSVVVFNWDVVHWASRCGWLLLCCASRALRGGRVERLAVHRILDPA